MSDQQSGRVNYVRKGRETKISGNAHDIKKIIWFDQLRPLIMTILILSFLAAGFGAPERRPATLKILKGFVFS